MLAYLHPLLGGVALALLVYAAAIGLRGRNARFGQNEILARHARVAPIAYGLVAASWVVGLLSALFLRDDLIPAASFHFQIGSAVALLLTASAISSRWMQGSSEAARDLHPWFGVLAVLSAAAQAVTGLQLIP